MSLLINCDLGEGLNNESDLMPLIQACNIACGGHAGDVETMKNVVGLAIRYGVKIGAHPSYPDKENFGRKSLDMADDELISSIQEQVHLLHQIVLDQKSELYHIKPHGALYNDVACNEKIANVLLKALLPYKKEVKLFVPFASVIEKLALAQGFSILYEAFADRNYTDELRLVSRQNPHAVLTNVKAVKYHVNCILETGMVMTLTGKWIPIKVDTFCVHSDTENVVEILKGLHNL